MTSPTTTRTHGRLAGLDLAPRAALFVPATEPSRIAKAFASGADAVIVDLEDAVADADKAAARESLLAASPLAVRGGPTALLRINSPLGDIGRADLEAARECGIDGVVVPRADLVSVDLAARSGIPVVALLETAAGILQAPEIAARDAVRMLMLAPADLAVELGVELSHEGNELNAARSNLVLAAAAAGLPAPLDGPCLALRDRLALEIELKRARRLGFGGKACVHPAQVAAVTAAFSPSEDEVAWARETQRARGLVPGRVFPRDGEMLDTATLRKAHRILTLAAEGAR